MTEKDKKILKKLKSVSKKNLSFICFFFCFCVHYMNLTIDKF